MLETISIIDFFGGLGAMLIAGSFACKNDRIFLIILSLGCLTYGIHFFLLEVYFASLLQVVTVSRLWVATRVKSLKVAHVFAFIYFVLLSYSWTGYQDLLTLTAVLISTYSVLVLSGIKMRMALLLPSILWLAHNIYIETFSGIVLEFLVITINTRTIYQLIKKEKQKEVIKNVI